MKKQFRTSNYFNFYYVILLLILFIFNSCESEVTMPKPRGFPHITLPAKNYKLFSSDCPFTFQHPDYAIIEAYKRDSTKICWKNIQLPKFNATIHLSYNTLQNDLNKFLDDSRKLAYKHTVKAQFIDEKSFYDTKRKVYAMVYDIGGNTASSYQFFATDSTQHFLRGALYFNFSPNADSIAPVNQFIKEDIIHLIETLEWK